jgi:hypothetical protein
MPLNIGERVGVVQYFDVDRKKVRFLGYGILEADGALLDNGDKILPGEGWWSSEESMKVWLIAKPQYIVENVSIKEIRQVKEERIQLSRRDGHNLVIS